MLGMAASSVPCLLLPEKEWESAYESVPALNDDLQPYLRDGESQEQVQEYVQRSKAAFGVLREALDAYNPDVLIVVGCWRNESLARTATFTMLTPANAGAALDSPAGKQAEYSPRSRDFVADLGEELVGRGFDLAWQPMDAASLPESISVAMEGLAASTQPLVIPILINASTRPLSSAERCWELGAAIKDVLNGRDEKVAVLATGGLSSDLLARWVDEPFDRWFLKTLETSDAEALKRLFRVETEILLGRTGEIRAWITAAAACGVNAEVVDYFPARQARSGLGFVLWREDR